MIRLTDHHAPRLAKMYPDVIRPGLLEEVESGARVIVEDAQFSIKDGAVSGPGHIPSLPGEPPNADTHVLDESGHVGEVVEVEGLIRATAEFDAEYALYLELGTSRMAERPFLAPATQRNRDGIVRSIAQRLRDERA